MPTFADGPHWHVPNPDPESPSDNEEDKDPKPRDPDDVDIFNGSYNRCPGDFKQLDQLVAQYYQTHCMVADPRNRGRFYEQIVHHCAQAMREVDTYSPCPDSYPLWKSEKKRERMIQYAQRTWLLCTELEPAIATSCVKLCVDCYIDGLRFSDDGQNKVGRMKQIMEVQKRLSEIITVMATHKDAGARNQAQAQWFQLGSQYHRMVEQLAGTYATFTYITGDLPVLVDDGNARMRETLAKMGLIVVPALEAHAKHANKTVQKAVLGLIEQIKSNYRNPTYDNVLALLRALDERGGFRAGQLNIELLKSMGREAWPHLVTAAGKEKPSLALCALKALNRVTDRSYGNNLKEWQEFVASVTPKANEVADADAADEEMDEDDGKKPRKKMGRTAVPLGGKDKHRDLKEDTTPDIVIKRRPGYVEAIDEE